jgi:tetratricopeptide (TPR) repeat protein
MKQLIQLGFCAILAMAVFSCNDQKEGQTNGTKLNKEQARVRYLAIIDSLETKALAKKNEPINSALGFSLVKFYAEFADHYADDPKSPEYLFKAGDISSNLNAAQPAIEYYKKITEKYPQYEKAPLALFLQGFIYENQLNDTASAGKIYREVIGKYPGTQVAKDAAASIQHLGKTPEQLIQEFEKMQGKGA